jgi:hypothetical protein
MACVRIVVATLLIASGILSAEEKSWALRTADLVVVGKLELSSYFLSFDGIHINGNIVPTEILYGPVQSGVGLRYNNLIPCSLWDSIRPDRSIGCDYRWVWSSWSSEKERLTQKGIWLLWRGPEASWRGRGWDPGFASLDYRDYAVSTLSERKQLETRH